MFCQECHSCSNNFAGQIQYWNSNPINESLTLTAWRQTSLCCELRGTPLCVVAIHGMCQGLIKQKNNDLTWSDLLFVFRGWETKGLQFYHVFCRHSWLCYQNQYNHGWFIKLALCHNQNELSLLKTIRGMEEIYPTPQAPKNIRNFI